MENPDVVLELVIEDKGDSESISLQYKANNREPDNNPVIEFLEALAIVFSDTNSEEE